LDKKAKDLLTPAVYEVVSLRLQDHELPAIAEALNLTGVTARQRLSRGRKVLVEQFIKPAGLEPAARFGNAIQQAAHKGNIESVKFLGMYYITEQIAQTYLQTRSMQVDISLLEQGYLLAINALSSSEYENTRVKKLLLRHQNRLYVHPDQISQIQSIIDQALPFRVPPPEPGYLRLSSFAHSGSDYGILVRAARKGAFATIKQGHWWWSTQEAVDQFRQIKS